MQHMCAFMADILLLVYFAKTQCVGIPCVLDRFKLISTHVNYQLPCFSLGVIYKTTQSVTKMYITNTAEFFSNDHSRSNNYRFKLETWLWMK